MATKATKENKQSLFTFTADDKVKAELRLISKETGIKIGFLANKILTEGLKTFRAEMKKKSNTSK